MSYMKAEFDRILKEYGHDIYLNRKVQNQTGEPEYSNTFEIHTVRYRAPNAALPNVSEESAEGISNTTERVYYFRLEANPFEGDRIYEQDPRVQQTVWEVDSAIMLRGLGGQGEYWAVGATRIRPN